MTESAAYMKALRAAKKEKGECIECSTIAVKGQRRCEKHRAAHAAHTRANSPESRVEHRSIGDPCYLCKKARSLHRIRGHRVDNRRKRARDDKRVRSRPGREKEPEETTYIGIDGEGQGRGFHKYVMLAASKESGESWTVENVDGLTTIEALEFILALPVPTRRVKIFAYAFNYDLTKFLQDLDNESLYKLFRPELRQRLGVDARKGPWPVKWKGYRLNLQGTKFTVSKGKVRRVIWDLFKFYQSKFVAALDAWKVGSKETRAQMQLMKDQRQDFDKLSPKEIKAYCFQECQYMAELGHKLVDAHEDAGLKLRSFYGAGSSGGAILDKLNIKAQLKMPSDEMKMAIASAFFGGRFENGRIGKVEGKVWNKDISSAYPYHLTFLPCLMHGRWELTRDRHRIDSRSLVHYELEFNHKTEFWAPFPFRTVEGSICFPNGSGGGWVWGEEYLAGEAHFSGVIFKQAWIYHKNCDCQPFAQMPHYYRERCRIGKEGAGIVLKLGPNSCYGKLAQSVGSALYQSWIWAGMITSGCRAQALEIIGLHKDRANLLMIATDGTFSLEDVASPKPRDTDTEATGKPLGGWETKVIDKGMFLARPGIYFPMNPTIEELKDVRGRGVGKGVVLENWRGIVDSYERFGQSRAVRVANVSRFCGAKTSISRAGSEKSGFDYTRASGIKGPTSPSYGQWITREVEMSFDPMPKRECVIEDGFTLKLRTMPRNLVSTPYDKAVKSIEARMLAMAAQEMLEQPDADLGDYEAHDY